MKIDTLFPSKYLKSSDIEEAGGELFGTIKEVGTDTMPDGANKAVVAFEEIKPLILNVTNKNVIKGLYGDETDLWKGKKVLLYTAEVSFGSKTTTGIRVKDEVPEAPF
ncbi:MAG: hypothetical protein IH937_11890 [Acidobacteria bacterium]|nr:hypothetical protein [Acidobacteriota bacterium]